MKHLFLTFCFISGLIPPLHAAGRDLMNIWHIPANEEPPSVTMRNPLIPAEGDSFIYIYCGGFPIGTIWAGTLHYRLQGEAVWQTSNFLWDSNNGNNEYFSAALSSVTYTEGDILEYYLGMEGDSAGGVDDTYVYGDDSTSTTTSEEAAAQAAPFTVTISGPRPTPTATNTPGPQLLNVWHIPTNSEPAGAGVTMRNPLYPDSTADSVFIYCGAYPTGAAASGGTLHWRLTGEPAWSDTSFTFDSVQGSNDYWIAEMDSSIFETDDTILYYLKMEGPPPFSTTYVYGNDDDASVTGEEGTAQADPFSFTIGTVPTPAPTHTPGPQPTINVWHIPINSEPSGTTMRAPLYPSNATETVSIYCGGNPTDAVWSGSLLYRYHGAPTWQAASFTWDVTHGENAYYIAELNNAPYPADMIVEYYLAMAGDPSSTAITYVYGSDDSTQTSSNEADALAHPFTYTVGWSGPSPTPTMAPPTSTPAPPTLTPTSAGMTPTPTPPPTRLGVRLEMPGTMYYFGDTCSCDAFVENPGDTIPGVRLFVFLDIGIGEYWFWPSWTHFPPNLDYKDINADHGVTRHVVLPEFTWPAVSGSAVGIRIYGGMTNASMTSVIGDIGMLEFGWSS